MSSKFLHILNNSCNDTIEDLDIFPFELDNFQKHACSKISQSENILVIAKTGVGKTVPAIYGINNSLKKNKKIIYTTPIKSLSNQKYKELAEKFPSVGIMTGDIKFNPTAQCIIMTTEILRNILYNSGPNSITSSTTISDISIDEIDKVIFDEVHYINNNDRGIVWEECMILLPKRITMIMLSATIDKPEDFASWLGDLKQKPINLIIKNKRIIPLTHYYYNNEKLMEIADNDGNFKNYDLLRKEYKIESINKLMNPFVEFLKYNELLPCLFFIFSRAKCEKYCKMIQKHLITTEESCLVDKIFNSKLAKYKHLYEKTPQYNELYSLLKKGIAYHHSGVIPVLKEIVEILFEQGLVKILFCTETFAVGINAPTKTAIFTKLSKFSDGGLRYLQTDEYLQMAGRAGRRGLDKLGRVIILPIEELVEEKVLQKMIVGKSPCVTSKFYYTYQFLLKLIDNKDIDLNDFIETSLYNIDTIKNINSYTYDLQQLSNKKYDEISEDIKKLFNKYDSNKTIINDPYIKIKGNKLNKMRAEMKKIEDISNFNEIYMNYMKNKQLDDKKLWIENNIDYLKNFNKIEINNIIDFLLKYNYVTFNDTISVFNPIEKINYMNNYNSLVLNVKGIIGKNINECNEVLFTELLMSRMLHTLKPAEIVCVLCVFIDEKGEDVYLSDLDIPEASFKTIKQLDKMSKDLCADEATFHLNIRTEWDLFYNFVEAGYSWASGKSIYHIHNYNTVQEGNFIRNIIRIDNLCENVKLICEIIKDYELLQAIQSIHNLIIRDQVTTESLYIK